MKCMDCNGSGKVDVPNYRTNARPKEPKKPFDWDKVLLWIVVIGGGSVLFVCLSKSVQPSAQSVEVVNTVAEAARIVAQTCQAQQCKPSGNPHADCLHQCESLPGRSQ